MLLISRTAVLALGVLAAIPACAQYPGQIAKSSKDSPELRSIAVLEWTGDLGKPKASRLVPVAVLDAGTLQDGGIYLARPEPLALAGEVEYELDQDGKPVGLFDIKNTGQEQGSWVGYGWWKPMPVERPKQPKLDMSKFDDDDPQSDVPVLHRKHHADDAPSAGSKGGSSGSRSSSSGGASGGSGAPAADSDPDRPTLHRSPSSGSSDPGTAGTTPAGTTGTNSTGTGSSSSEPTLHRKDSPDSSGTGSGSGGSAGSGAGESSGTTAADDPDRPVMKKSHKKQPEDVAHVDSLPDDTDPDRPRLKRGRSNADNLQVSASLMGLPPDMQQAVAVSDAKTHPEHPWDYSWANPDDETKMKLALEDMARTALGLNPPLAPPAPKKATNAKTTTAAKTTTRRAVKPVAPPTPPEPAPLLDEKFRVFELSYGAGATLVLTAHTAGPLAQEKFVSLVAQPDLYGNLLVLLKSVTDGAHLDDTPRMRLVDAVDALADNRGELLFELRGATQRQFALYRVVRGQAEKLFVSGGGEFSMESSE
jgi:hypothetical protein